MQKMPKVPLTPEKKQGSEEIPHHKGPKIEKNSISLEILNLAWKIQPRLKTSILTFRIAHKKWVGGRLLCGVIRANGFARIGWFARIRNSSDSGESARRAINGVNNCNCEWFARIDSRESRCESPVPLRAARLKFFGDRYDWTTGAPDNGNEWGKFRAVPRSYPLRPLFCALFNIGGWKQKRF